MPPIGENRDRVRMVWNRNAVRVARNLECNRRNRNHSNHIVAMAEIVDMPHIVDMHASIAGVVLYRASIIGIASIAGSSCIGSKAFRQCFDVSTFRSRGVRIAGRIHDVPG